MMMNKGQRSSRWTYLSDEVHQQLVHRTDPFLKSSNNLLRLKSGQSHALFRFISNASHYDWNFILKGGDLERPCSAICWTMLYHVLGKVQYMLSNIKLPFTIHSCFGSLVTQLVEENKSRRLLPPSIFVFIGVSDSSSSMHDCATVPHGCGWTW